MFLIVETMSTNVVTLFIFKFHDVEHPLVFENFVIYVYSVAEKRNTLVPQLYVILGLVKIKFSKL
jgi:hypothetical protein